MATPFRGRQGEWGRECYTPPVSARLKRYRYEILTQNSKRTKKALLSNKKPEERENKNSAQPFAAEIFPKFSKSFPNFKIGYCVVRKYILRRLLGIYFYYDEGRRSRKKLPFFIALYDFPSFHDTTL